jgi:hypothetical protein
LLSGGWSWTPGTWISGARRGTSRHATKRMLCALVAVLCSVFSMLCGVVAVPCVVVAVLCLGVAEEGPRGAPQSVHLSPHRRPQTLSATMYDVIVSDSGVTARYLKTTNPEQFKTLQTDTETYSTRRTIHSTVTASHGVRLYSVFVCLLSRSVCPPSLPPLSAFSVCLLCLPLTTFVCLCLPLCVSVCLCLSLSASVYFSLPPPASACLCPPLSASVFF